MSETKNLKLFINDNPPTNKNPFNVEKSINVPYQQIDEFAEKAGTKLNLNIDTSNYIMTLELVNINEEVIDTKTIDFPLESVVVDGKYENKKIILTLQNGNTVEIPVGALIDGLVSQETFDENIGSINVEITKVKSRLDNIEKEQTISKYTVPITELIQKESEYTLPCNYKVGNHSLRVHWENVLLEEGEDGNYMEIGEPDSVSNKIKFGWDIEPGETLIIEVRGVVDE